MEPPIATVDTEFADYPSDELARSLADTDLISVFAGALQHAASWTELTQTVQMSPAEIATVLWRVNERSCKYAYTEGGEE